MQLRKGEILKVNERYTRPRLTPHVQCVPAATDPQSSAVGAPGAYASSTIAECLDALKPCLTATKKKEKKEKRGHVYRCTIFKKNRVQGCPDDPIAITRKRRNPAGSARPASRADGTDDSPARLDPQHTSRLSAPATPHVC